MHRYVWLFMCTVALLSGCKGHRSASPVPPTATPTLGPNTVSVTVVQSASPQSNVQVTESTDYNTITGAASGTIITTATTDASGVASFTAPSNPASQYCFSVAFTPAGATQPVKYHNCQDPLTNFSITLGI